jgi:hypothetical protein
MAGQAQGMVPSKTALTGQAPILKNPTIAGIIQSALFQIPEEPL